MEDRVGSEDDGLTVGIEARGRAEWVEMNSDSVWAKPWAIEGDVVGTET